MLVEELLRRPQCSVINAERRSPVAGNVAGGGEPGFPVAAGLVEREADERLVRRKEYPSGFLQIFVVERRNGFGHSSRQLSFRSAMRSSAWPPICRSRER